MGIHFGNRPTGNARYSPPAPEGDPFFNQTSLLLLGNGTNGAQNNTFVDGSTNNFTVTRNGNTTQGTFTPFSQPAGAWSNYFDGTGDYITAPANAAWVFSGDVTFECWINIQADSATDNNGARSAVLFRNAITGTVNFQFMLNGDANTTGTGISIFRSNDLALSANFTFAKNTWYHVAAVRHNNVWNLYVNGTSYATTTFSATIGSSARTMEIGGSAYGGFANMIIGYISNARMVNGTAVYTSAFTPPTAPLTTITNTVLLTCQDNRFRDGSSNNFSITRNGDVRVTAFSPFAPTAAYSTSVNGGSGYFDGAGDYLTFTKNTTTSSFTLEAFVYPLTAEQQWLFGGDGTVNATNNVQFRFNTSTGTIDFILNGAAVFTVTNTFIPIRSWSHIVFARSSTTCAIFLNGVRIGTGTSSAALNVTHVGTYAASNFFNGYISNARIVNSDVYGIGNETYTVPSAPLTAITNTYLLLNFTNGGIIDSTGKNVLETTNTAQVSSTKIKYGTGSIFFDGNLASTLIIPASPQFLLTGDFTIEFWINAGTSQVNTFSGIGAPTRAKTTTDLGIYMTSGYVYFEITNNGGGNTVDSILDNNWHHVALTRSGTTLRCFLDGVEKTTSTHSGNVDMGFASNYRFGRGWNSDNRFGGYLDDIRITQGVARYTSNFTPPAQELLDR